ncbi:MAG: bacteriohemerythrin [Candidatus Zixiibacteriota bacterium]
MAFINWDNSYSVKIPQMDEEHQKLIDILNDLYTRIRSGIDDHLFQITIDDLIDYTRFHFINEEELMREGEYPELEKHLKMHEGFTKQVIQFQNDFYVNKITPSAKAMEFLWNWLLNHILTEDKKYGEFLTNRTKVMSN